MVSLEDERGSIHTTPPESEFAFRSCFENVSMLTETFPTFILKKEITQLVKSRVRYSASTKNNNELYPNRLRNHCWSLATEVPNFTGCGRIFFKMSRANLHERR